MLIVTVNRNVHTRARNDDKPWWAADLGRPLSGVQFTNKQLSDHSKEFHHRFDSPLDSPPASRDHYALSRISSSQTKYLLVRQSSCVLCRCAPLFRHVIIQLSTTECYNFCELRGHVKASRLVNLVVAVRNDNPVTTVRVNKYKSSYTL